MPADLTRTSDGLPSARSDSLDVDTFLAQAGRSIQDRGRLIFALDATMSRQPTWDRACRLQGEMFTAVEGIGSLAVQLLYYRGFSECRASKWVGDAAALRDLMTRIDCRGGHTQISKVLAHARRETGRHRVNALVFIGDAVEEGVDDLCRAAGELGVLGLPCFMVQEGRESTVETAFREIARLSGGAYLRFDEGSAAALSNLLRAVAAFASGGYAALERDISQEGRLLLEQMRRPGATGP
ncbi:VWA domain-containing protein [Consotaella aegiceratis]|uniref:VWA domain-containing protein n=1 Tax=Consotaella aegiceratis TaxID=3097961 RepID=UPI002F3FF1CA